MSAQYIARLDRIYTYLDFDVNVCRFVDAGRDHWQLHDPLDGHKMRKIRLPRSRHDI